jgi:hypothetical protein
MLIANESELTLVTKVLAENCSLIIVFIHNFFEISVKLRPYKN